MNRLLLLISLLSLGILKSQTEQNAATVGDFMHENYLKWTYPWLENLAAGKKIKEFTSTEVLKNKTSDSFYFNEKSRLVKAMHQHYYDNSLGVRTSEINEYTYDQIDNLIQVKHFSKKNELTYSQNWSYYSPKQFSSSIKTVKGKVFREALYFYNVDSTLAKNESIQYKKSGRKSESYYLYSYNENKKLNHTKFYKENKLKYTWDYSCDERGKMAKKDTSSICTSEGLDSKGRKIVTKFNTDNKGHVTKTISFYKEKFGTEFRNEYQVYLIRNEEEIILYSIHEPDSLEPYREFKIYYNKGGLSHQETVTFSKYTDKISVIKNKNSRYFDKSGRSNYSLTETFNEKGLPLTSTKTGKNEKVQEKIEYVFTGDKEFTINHYRKNSLKKSYKATVSYY